MYLHSSLVHAYIVGMMLKKGIVSHLTAWGDGVDSISEEERLTLSMTSPFCLSEVSQAETTPQIYIELKTHTALWSHWYFYWCRVSVKWNEYPNHTISHHIWKIRPKFSQVKESKSWFSRVKLMLIKNITSNYCVESRHYIEIKPNR